MLNPFRALGLTLRDLFDEFMLLIGCNLIWVVMCGPLWVLAFYAALDGMNGFAVLVALLGVLPAGPATMGLVGIAQRITEGRASKLSDFFAAMRRYARAGWLFAGAWMGGLLLVLLNLGYYNTVGGWLGVLMSGLWLYGLIFWLSLLIYAPALIVLQEVPTLRLVARNSVLMVAGRPIFTLVNLALMGLLIFVSLALVVPMFVLTISLLSLWGMHATNELIADARRRREQSEAADNAPQPAEDRGRKGQVRPK
jgi:hypothetical protein